MKNNVQIKSIITSILFMCSYSSTLLSSEKSILTQNQDNNNVTPLHFAMTEEEVTAILNDCPQNLNAQDSNGFTPIQCMIKNGNIAAMMTMKERGAKMTRQDQIKYVNLLKQECVHKTRK